METWRDRNGELAPWGPRAADTVGMMVSLLLTFHHAQIVYIKQHLDSGKIGLN